MGAGHARWAGAAADGLGSAAAGGEIPEGLLDGPWDVARGTPNGFGLLDLGTVVHEWCLDWYAPGYYAAAPGRDPRGPEEGQRRSSKGGSWRHRVRWSPPSARSSSLPPEFHYADYGLRVLVGLGRRPLDRG